MPSILVTYGRSTGLTIFVLARPYTQTEGSQSKNALGLMIFFDPIRRVSEKTILSLNIQRHAHLSANMRES